MIPSFKEYLLIHQDRPHVEHYSKQDAGGWLLKEYSGEEAFEIARLSATVSLASLYDDAFTSGG